MSVWTSFAGIVTLSPESGVNVKNVISQCFVNDDVIVTTRVEKGRHNLFVHVSFNVDTDATDAAVRLSKALEKAKIITDSKLKADIRISGRVMV